MGRKSRLEKQYKEIFNKHMLELKKESSNSLEDKINSYVAHGNSSFTLGDWNQLVKLNSKFTERKNIDYQGKFT
jgi:hypothetical protein